MSIAREIRAKYPQLQLYTLRDGYLTSSQAKSVADYQKGLEESCRNRANTYTDLHEYEKVSELLDEASRYNQTSKAYTEFSQALSQKGL